MKIVSNIAAVLKILILGVFMMVLCAVPAMAKEIPELDTPCSITVYLKDSSSADSEAVPDTALTLYRVANCAYSTNSIKYDFVENFRNSGASIEALTGGSQASEEIKKLVEYAKLQNLSSDDIKVSDSDGKVLFDHLQAGIYMILSEGGGPYEITETFLVLLPMEGYQGTSWIYHVVAYPKTQNVSGMVVMNKVSSSGKKLEGAIFRLEKKDADGNWGILEESMTTDKNGQIVKTGLPYGSYRFIETKAPSGYILDKTPHEFVILRSETVELKVTNNPDSGAGNNDNQEVKPSGGNDSENPPKLDNINAQDVPLGTLMQIKDNISIILGQEVPAARLPQTGQELGRIIIYFALGLILIVYGTSDILKKKRDKNGAV